MEAPLICLMILQATNNMVELQNQHTPCVLESVQQKMDSLCSTGMVMKYVRVNIRTMKSGPFQETQTYVRLEEMRQSVQFSSVQSVQFSSVQPVQQHAGSWWYGSDSMKSPTHHKQEKGSQLERKPLNSRLNTPVGKKNVIFWSVWNFCENEARTAARDPGGF